MVWRVAPAIEMGIFETVVMRHAGAAEASFIRSVAIGRMARAGCFQRGVGRFPGGADHTMLRFAIDRR